MENYEKPQSKEITDHAGNYGGLLVQLQKLMASIINEFFVFLKKNATVFTESEFKEVLNRLPISEKRIWDNMIAAAHGKFPQVSDLLKATVQIRSNIGFHFDHSGKILRNAYVSRFFGNVKDEKSRLAYYSLGDTIETTRFYFSDAAVEEALYIATGKQPKENSIGGVSLGGYQRQVFETIEVMSTTILLLIKNYIQLRRNQPH